MTSLVLAPAMPLHGHVDPDHSTWVGSLDVHHLSPAVDRLHLTDAEAFSRARLLVRDGRAVRGYAEIGVVDGVADAEEVRGAIAQLPSAAPAPDAATMPITVVVCTHERPALLHDALASIVALDYPDVEIVVVDNAPRTSETRDLVDVLFPTVRYVREDRVGLSWARNAGVAAASHEIVAFTDDDVIADPLWLRGVAAGFARADDIACVTGLVPSGELRNAVQQYFDGRVHWARLTRGRTFRLSEPPADLPMFPFCVGEYGTGANFAIRRDTVLGLGGFDTALGAGTETKGGEDLDMFVRVIFAGGAIAVEPAAIIWHRHRSDLDALRAQALGYGRGLGAWLLTLACSPRMLGPALGRALGATRVLIAKRAPEATDTGAPETAALSAELTDLNAFEVRSVLGGPAAYVRERRRQLSRDAVAGPGGLPGAVRAAVPQLWLGLGALGAVLALLGALPAPAWVSGPLVLAFVLLGPGSVVRAWTALPPHLTALAVPGVGAAAIVLVTTLLAMTSLWAPTATLVGLALATLAAAIVSFLRMDRRPAPAGARAPETPATAPEGATA